MKMTSEQKRLFTLRSKRKNLLRAADIYRLRLATGFAKATEEELAGFNEWYRKVLDLDEGAIRNPIAKIAEIARK